MLIAYIDEVGEAGVPTWGPGLWVIGHCVLLEG